MSGNDLLAKAAAAATTNQAAAQQQQALFAQAINSGNTATSMASRQQVSSLQQLLCVYSF